MLDVESAGRQWLASQLSCRVVTSLPKADKLAAACPIVLVYRSAGGNGGALPRAMDVPAMQINAYAYNASDGVTAIDAARKLGEQVRDLVMDLLPGQIINGLYVSRVGCQMGPRRLQYPNDLLSCYAASYTWFCQAA